MMTYRRYIHTCICTEIFIYIVFISFIFLRVIAAKKSRLLSMSTECPKPLQIFAQALNPIFKSQINYLASHEHQNTDCCLYLRF